MSTQVAPGSSTAVEEKTRPSFDDGDAERFSHYVPKAKLTDADGQRDPRRRPVRQGMGTLPQPREIPCLPGVQRDLRLDEPVNTPMRNTDLNQ